MLLPACWGPMSLDSLKSSPTRTTWSVTSSLELGRSCVHDYFILHQTHLPVRTGTGVLLYEYQRARGWGPASRACEGSEADPPSRPEGPQNMREDAAFWAFWAAPEQSRLSGPAPGILAGGMPRWSAWTLSDQTRRAPLHILHARPSADVDPMCGVKRPGAVSADLAL